MMQAVNPLVSMIVLSYNHCQYVLETLESVKAQTYQPTQLIILDDCSADDSAAVIERWVQESNVDCTFIRHQKNQGICKSLNDALAVATGKYVSMVASDDMWLPDKISRQVEVMESQPDNVGVLYSDVFQIDENGHILPGLLIATNWKLPEMPHGQVLNTLLRGNFIPGLTTMIRRSCYDEVGVYDENLPWEDWDMWMRIARHYSFLYSPTPSAKYRIHEKSFSRSDPGRMLKEQITIALKQYRMGDLTADQTSTLIETLLGYSRELYSRIRGESADILLALWHATRDQRFRRMYWFVRFGFDPRGYRSLFRTEFLGLAQGMQVTRDTARVRFWHPVLNLTRPLRHALGLRQKGLSPTVKK